MTMGPHRIRASYPVPGVPQKQLEAIDAEIK
jgi:hypothetical protein